MPRRSTEMFNAWVARHALRPLARWRREAGVAPGEPLPRLRKKDFAKAPRTASRPRRPFISRSERNYFRDMAAFLRGELGVKSLLIGDSDHHHGDSGYPVAFVDWRNWTLWTAMSTGNIPATYTDPHTGRQTGFSIANTPMVDEPLQRHGRPAFALGRGGQTVYGFGGQPPVSERVCLRRRSAPGGLRGAAGLGRRVLVYARPPGRCAQRRGVLQYFDLAPDPVKLSQLAAGALLFVRGDVRAAQRTSSRSYSRQQVIESLRLGSTEWPYFTPGFPLALPLVHGVRTLRSTARRPHPSSR